MRISTKFLAALSAIVAGLALLMPVQAQKAPDEGKAEKPDAEAVKAERKRMALELFKKLKESTSLLWDADAITTVSEQDGDDILPLLLNSYFAPPVKPEENISTLLASAIKRRYSANASDYSEDTLKPRRLSEADLKVCNKYMASEGGKEPHVWATFCVALAMAQGNDPEINTKLLGIIRNAKNPPLLRAAVIEAVSRSGFDTLKGDLAALIMSPVKANIADAVVLESLFWAVARAYRPKFEKDKPVSADWSDIFFNIIEKLGDEKNTLPRTRREAALSLQWCFGTKYPYAQPIQWKGIFESGKDPMRDEGNTVANFMGVDALGDRVLFLIDASDSMLNPLAANELEGFKKPITGEKKPKRNKDEYDIDWGRVKNRFDLAREHVKFTLSRLGKDKSAAIILFGDSVKVLSATPSFTSCGAGSVRQIMAALDDIKVQPPKESVKERPYGTLMGETNYYSSLLAAFRMGKSGILKEPTEHREPKLFTEGADTIFLLSDGAPIVDGFKGNTPEIEYKTYDYTTHDSEQPGEGRWVEVPAQPASEPYEYETVDPETGIRTKHTVPGQPARPASRYWLKITPTTEKYAKYDDNGPYVGGGTGGFFVRRSRSGTGFQLSSLSETAHFSDELERMNLLRKVLINCIGIGEAKLGWLKSISRLGRGKTVYFDKDGEHSADDQPSRGKLPPGFPGMPDEPDEPDDPKDPGDDSGD